MTDKTLGMENIRVRSIKIKKEVYRSEFRSRFISVRRVAIQAKLSKRHCRFNIDTLSSVKYCTTYPRYYEIQVFVSLSLSLSLSSAYTRYTQVFQLCRLQSSFRYRQPHGHSRALTPTTKRINAAAHLTRIEIFGEYSSLSWSSVLWISVEIFMVQFALLFAPTIRRRGESPVRERRDTSRVYQFHVC